MSGWRVVVCALATLWGLAARGDVALVRDGKSDYVIVLGPHAIAGAVLAHELGHPLGFKDGYFRSYENRGAEGYEVLEVILGPADGVQAPEGGWVRREHFEQIIREKQR